MRSLQLSETLLNAEYLKSQSQWNPPILLSRNWSCISNSKCGIEWEVNSIPKFASGIGIDGFVANMVFIAAHN